MTKTRNISDLLDANGDVKSAALDNVPPSNDASALTTGTVDNARLSLDAATIPNLDTAKITTGTFSDARMPSTVLNSNVDLTNLSATNLTSGTVPDARFPATLPTASGANLTSLNASNLSTGTVPIARIGSGTKNSTTFLRGDNTFAAPSGGANTPAFRAYATSIQSGLQNFTKINFPNEEFDTDGAFSSSRFTVPSGKGGKYVFSASIMVTAGSGMQAAQYVLYKNGSQRIQTSLIQFTSQAMTNTGWVPVFLINASAGDYFEMYYQMNNVNTSGGAQTDPYNASNQQVWFWGFKLVD